MSSCKKDIFANLSKYLVDKYEHDKEYIRAQFVVGKAVLKSWVWYHKT